MFDRLTGPPLADITLAQDISGKDTSGKASSVDKRAGAAKDFEALLLSQMLHTMRESGSGWLGTGEDQSFDAAMGMAEEQFGRALVAGGGIGLAKFVAGGIKPES